MSREQLIERIQRRVKLVKQEEVLRQVDELLAKATIQNVDELYDKFVAQYPETMKKLAQ